MSKKKKILISMIIFILLLIINLLVLSMPKENYSTYTCKKEQSIVNGNLETTYLIKYQKEDIKKVEYTLKYYGKTKEEKDNINTLSQIVKEEAKIYQKESGFSYKINRQIPTEFKITYYFDISKAKSEFLNNFNIKQKFKDQKDYFINKEEYICH